MLEALIARGITGEGTKLEVSLFDGMADWMSVPLMFYEATGRDPERIGLAHPTICPYGAFPTKDNSAVLISIQNEREWADFCTHFMQDAGLRTRSGYESNVARVANRKVVDEELPQIIRRGMTSFKVYLTYDMLKLDDYQVLDVLNVAFATVLEQQNADAAYQLVRDEMRRSPTLLGLDKLLEAQLIEAPPQRRQDLELVKNLVHQHTRTLAMYKCDNCGFRARQYYWHCPACGEWETYSPRRAEEKGLPA